MKHIFNVVQPPPIVGVFLLENSRIFQKAEKKENNRHCRFQSLRNLTQRFIPGAPAFLPIHCPENGNYQLEDSGTRNITHKMLISSASLVIIHLTEHFFFRNKGFIDEKLHPLSDGLFF